MNYNNVYMSIILRAQQEMILRKRIKRNGSYYERHHIIPKSLGGANAANNLVLLTPREHFVCHLLLTKLYPAGSVSYNKMYCALWRMSVRLHHTGSILNSHMYELIRQKYGKIASGNMKSRQSGIHNSNYGNKWFTNYVTGESRLFRGTPSDAHWIPGRNLFNGQSYSILYLYTNSIGSVPPKNVDFRYKKNRVQRRQYLRNKDAVLKTRILWDRFHSESHSSLSAFAKTLNMDRSWLRRKFFEYIPLFKSDGRHGHVFRSNADLIGVYE